MLVAKKFNIYSKEFNLFGDEDDHYFMTIPSDFTEHDVIFDLLHKIGYSPKNILDIGANIGLFAFGAFAAFPTSRIHAYEPHPEIFLALERNKELANGRIVASQIALGASCEYMRFHPGGPININRSSGSHLFNDDHWKDPDDSILVECSTVDNQVNELGLSFVNFIKIDVEGFEMDVLNGANDAIARFDPIIFLEFNSWALIAIKNINPREFMEYLRSKFCSIYRVNQDRTLTPLRTHEDSIVFLHDNLVVHGCVDDLIVCKSHDPFVDLTPENFTSISF